MAKNYFRRYIWLIELINRKGYISFREISDAWSRSPLNETGAPLSERTFFNHKDAIFGTFGIGFSWTGCLPARSSSRMSSAR